VVIHQGSLLRVLWWDGMEEGFRHLGREKNIGVNLFLPAKANKSDRHSCFIPGLTRPLP